MNSVPPESIRQVFDTAEDYPEALRELADRPPVLYVRGRWPLSQQCRIGIVGTRRPSAYGLESAKRFTADLVSRDIVTVSGLAAGIDACAHRVTLEAGGWTVAVLGHGFGFQYPKENAPLFERMAAEGTLITEFSYDTGPDSRHFPLRNRIISGLSRGVLVVEAGHRSGAAITARFAAEQGKDVFVVPGSIFSPQSVGCHRLIKEGAKLVTSAEDILEEYGMALANRLTSSFPAGSGGESPPDVRRGLASSVAGMDPRQGHSGMTTVRKDDCELNQAEKDLFKFMSSESISIDELVEMSGLPVDRLAEVLLSLEIKGKDPASAGTKIWHLKRNLQKYRTS